VGIPAEVPSPQLSNAEAVAMLSDGALLIDVRGIDEWNAGHAPEATHIPLAELRSQIAGLDRSRRIIVICRSGRRSDPATAALRKAGYDAYNFSGGMHVWQQAGGAVHTRSGQPGSVI
jgi:rhodanese-related sulfurtransferase